MKKQEWTAGLDHIDSALVEQYVQQKETLTQKKKKRSFWLRAGALAACFVLILSAVVVGAVLKGDKPHHTPIIFAPIVSPESLTGTSSEFVVGSSLSSGGASGEPPAFAFDSMGFVTKAKVVNNNPDVYYKLDTSSERKATTYRLIQMECIQAIHGDVPQYFLYLIPERLYVDMSVYDSLLISMRQLGAEYYVLKNSTKNQMEAFELLIFADMQDHPDLGNIIAFTDSKFDESLWQTKSWRYGYQFGSFYLGSPEHSRHVVKRGASEKDTIANIKKQIKEDQERLGERYKTPACVNLNFSSQQAKEAIEFVKPFESGVFSQVLQPYNPTVTFRRFINGCQTEETITINLDTEEVVYSDVRYTDEDMANIENISFHLSNLAQEYATTTPTPPHTDPEEKKLLCLNLYAWYAKVDGKLYGVIKTAWRYQKADNGLIQYYDDSYILYDMEDSSAKNISRDDLVKIVGTRNVYMGKYGVEIDVPT